MTTVNESMVSSSPITASYGQDKSNKKRSISSSLLNFFSRITHNNENEINDSYPDEAVQIRKKKRLGYTKSSPSHNSSSDNGNDDNNSDYHFTYNKGTNSYMEQPLILYETDDHGSDNQDISINSIRPPILPILPIQRLKLLRRKQILRLKRDTELIQNIDSNGVDTRDTRDTSVKLFKPNNNKAIDLKQHQTLSYPEPLDFNQSVTINKLDTPSPVKNSSHIDELILDSTTNNIVINNKKRNATMYRNNNNNNNDNNKLIQLQSKRIPTKMNKNKFKGTRWSGYFKYDLSEYDTKPKISEPNGIIDTISNSTRQTDDSKDTTKNSGNNSSSSDSDSIANNNNNMINFESGKTFKIPISELAEFSETSITNKKLSKNKLNILIHGSKLQQYAKHNEILPKNDTVTEDETKNSKKKENSFVSIGKMKNENNDKDKDKDTKKSNIVLPTAGFDFLKNDVAQPKNITFSFNNQNKVDENKDKKDIITEKSLFSFSNSIKTGKDEDIEKKQEDKTAGNGSKLSFSFNTKNNFTSGQKDEQLVQKHPSSAVSIDLTKDLKKPTFTFTSNRNTDTENKTLSFSFGSQSNDNVNNKPNITTPKFSFGSTNLKSNNSTSIDTTKTPSFVFGTKSETAKNSSKDSRDNDNKEGSDEDDRRPRKRPTFSFTTPSTTDNKNLDAGIINATDTIKPSFNFGFANNTTNNKKDDGKETSKTPSFSFGLTNSNVEKKPLSFSFDSKLKSSENTVSASSKITPSEENNLSSLNFATNVSGTQETGNQDSKKQNIFSFGKNTSSEQASLKKTIGTAAKASNGGPSFTFGAKPATGTSETTQSTFPFNNKVDIISNDSSAKPSFTFGATTSSSTGKLGSTVLSKPSFSFGAPNKEATSINTVTSTASLSSVSKSAGTMDLQPNNDAKSLGVSLTNPLLSKSGDSNATNSGPSTNVASAGGGFKFARQQVLSLGTNIGQQDSTSASGTSLFGGNTAAGMNGMQTNNVLNNNNNNLGNNQGFNFTFNASNNNSNNSTMNSFGNNTNNNTLPGGSVFSFNNNNTSNNMFTSNNNMNGSSFKFGQQQQSQINNTFHPSSQVNFNFNQNANANPAEIFSGSLNNNNGMGNMTNTITPQPNQFPHRKIARMRASRR
ncbi:hypothetical protein RI543_001361 [Arxiozyma heterogenica]|uniref:Uncharacterized protein n=1 Tax=Arxiozyma heterogenica TaxID=278026 RepID=A0AAN7ZSV5_9SACH|nr:hypothetical protein RI543_001361 [Kazachstania heterogenica]